MKGNTKEMRKFIVSKEHLKLLKHLYIDWDREDLKANHKRPFGNSDIYDDIARILEWDVFIDVHGDPHLSGAEFKLAEEIYYKGLPIALQICLSNQKFETGTFYLEENYDTRDWIKV